MYYFLTKTLAFAQQCHFLYHYRHAWTPDIPSVWTLLRYSILQRHGGYCWFLYTLTHMIFRENPSIHPLTHSPYCFNLSYESICQRKFGPLLWYCLLLRRLFNLNSTPFGSKTHGVPRNRHSSLIGIEDASTCILVDFRWLISCSLWTLQHSKDLFYIFVGTNLGRSKFS